jgi:hypothetical protein
VKKFEQKFGEIKTHGEGPQGGFGLQHFVKDEKVH